MSALYWILMFLAVFWAVVLMLDNYYDMESRGAEVGPGVLMWRTDWGIDLLDRIAGVSKRVWKAFGVAGAILGFFFLGRVFFTLSENAYTILASIGAKGAGGAGGVGGVMPIIPGVTTPLVAGLVAIASVVVVHELSHGVLARRAGLSVDSTGVGILAFLPFAFVEPNKEELEGASLSDRLQVFSVGSFANILLGFLCFGLILSLINPLSGLYVWRVYENTPAENSLKPGMQIKGVGYLEGPFKTIENYQEFDNFMDSTSPQDNIIIEVDNQKIDLTLDNHPREDSGYIGIYPTQSIPRAELASKSFISLFVFWKKPALAGGPINEYSYDYLVPNFVIVLLMWMFIFNLGVGIFNLLPLSPLDGGKMFSASVEEVSSSSVARHATWAISIVTLSIILINLIPWLKVFL